MALVPRVAGAPAGVDGTSGGCGGGRFVPGYGAQDLSLQLHQKQHIKGYRWISDEADLQLCRTSMHRLLFSRNSNLLHQSCPKK